MQIWSAVLYRDRRLETITGPGNTIQGPPSLPDPVFAMQLRILFGMEVHAGSQHFLVGQLPKFSVYSAATT